MIDILREKTRLIAFGTILALSGSACAAAANDESDAVNKLEKLGYDNINITDEDAVLAAEYCGEGFGTSFEFEAERLGEFVIGRLCIPEVGEFFKKPIVIPTSRD